MTQKPSEREMEIAQEISDRCVAYGVCPEAGTEKWEDEIAEALAKYRVEVLEEANEREALLRHDFPVGWEETHRRLIAALVEARQRIRQLTKALENRNEP